MIRVLIADDSPVAVAALQKTLASDPTFAVVGWAKNGEDAVRLAAELRPDVITMDLEMPGLSGFEATRRIMAETPTPIVVIAAASQSVDAHLGFDALHCGAIDLIDKPRAVGVFTDEAVRDVCSRLRVAARVKPVRRDARIAPPRWHASSPVNRTPVWGADREIRGVLAIGASTGGPAALESLLLDLERPFPVPILVVQHMSPGFTRGFARWLGKATGLAVHLAATGMVSRCGEVYVAPDGAHLTVAPGGILRCTDAPPVDGLRPSVDVLFDSVGDAFGARAVAALLTGMGRDGARGLKRVRDAGGSTFVQDRASCAVWGMPGTALALAAADAETPLDALGAAIGRSVRRHDGTSSRNR